MRFNTLHHIHKILQNCWRKNFLNTQNPGASGGIRPRGSLPGQSPGPAGDLKRSPDPSPTFVPPNTKSWIRPCQSLFLFGTLTCSAQFVIFPFIRGLFASWICHCCLTSSVILSASIYRSVDTTNNSEVTWPKACSLHFRYKQWQKIPCYIFYDMRKNVNILNDSHVIVKFELRNKLPFRMRLVWRNTTSSFHFWSLQLAYNIGRHKA